MIEIRLLGGLEVLKAGALVVMPPSRKTRALLSYLALADRPVRRDALCDLLWDLPDDPRGALRWSLSKLRRLLDDEDRSCFEADRQNVFIAPDRTTVDLRVARAVVVEQTSTSELERTAALFRGALLADLDLPNCPGFQSWLITEREAAHASHTSILAELIARAADQPETALPYAHAWVRAAPHETSAWTRYVALLRAAGRDREADEQAQAAQTLLKTVVRL